MKRISIHLVSYLLLIPGLAIPGAVWASTPSSSTTTLTLSSSSVARNTAVTLTATVNSAGKTVAPGLVLFCDATATYCQDTAILGTAQLTSAGTASIKLTLGIGTHIIKAAFVGTNTVSGSSSDAQSLAVTGKYSTTSTVVVAGSSGNYTLSSTVAGIADINAGPTGNVSFLDALKNHNVLASAGLGASTLTLDFAQGKSNTLGSAGPVAVGDFNNDGKPDLALLDQQNSAVGILLGNGDGTFQNEVTHAAGTNPLSIEVGDFNSDGKQDLAVTNYGDNTVSIFLGNGDGSFQNQATYAAGNNPALFVVGDFNRDGIPDLAITDANISTTSNPPSLVSILLGKGDGSFQSPVQYNIASIVESIAAGDFNGDGIPDLAITSSLSTTANGVASILLGNGDGTFQNAVTYSTGIEPFSIVAGDFNGDGKPDLAAWNFSGSTISVLLNNGDGTFQNQKTYALIGPSESLAIGDFNRDGKLDLVTMNISGDPNRGTADNTVGILLGNGDGTFQKEVIYGSLQNSPDTFAVGDFNGDGNPDLVATNFWGGSSTVYPELNYLAQTATATATHVNGGNAQYVYSLYPGDGNHIGSLSCQIGLNTPHSGPILSGVTVSNVTATSATVSWTSNVATYGGVNYGLSSAGFTNTTPWVVPVSTAHSFTLTGLTPATAYNYQAWSVSYFSGCTHWTTFAPIASFTTAN